MVKLTCKLPTPNGWMDQDATW